MMAKLMFLIGSVVLIAACAGTPPAADSAAATQGKLVCSEQPVSYHVRQSICLTPEQVAARKKAAEEAAQKSQPPH
ncbi:MAG TPA: hypothetical protein VNF48_03440 [Gammaproteobacteria bacterium]|nr:hypothetical protein [Gammaproteobacteria bacterium]